MVRKRVVFLILVVATMLMAGMCVNAQGLNTVDVEFDIKPVIANMATEATFTLSDGNKEYTATAAIDADAQTAKAHFVVDEFLPGKDFKFKINSGFSSAQYYSYKFHKGEEIELWTYTDVDTSVPVSTFHMSATVENTKPVYFFVDFVPYPMTVPAQYYDGVLYIPAAEGAKSMGVSDITYVAETGEITYRIYGEPITMHIGSDKVSVFGVEGSLEAPPVILNEYPYIPLQSFSDIVGAPVLLQNEPDHINAVVTTSALVANGQITIERNRQINQAGVSSDTEYLIWVNKNDYKLRVYKGSKDNWKFVKELTCAIGTDATPTCVGTFKYYSRETIWPYNTYYVGPIMRFNGGYAIHSTLIMYNGVPYDNRVGMKLSHGCVRLQPQDIGWLINEVPLYSTVYITNY